MVHTNVTSIWNKHGCSFLEYKNDCRNIKSERRAEGEGNIDSFILDPKALRLKGQF